MFLIAATCSFFENCVNPPIFEPLAPRITLCYSTENKEPPEVIAPCLLCDFPGSGVRWEGICIFLLRELSELYLRALFSDKAKKIANKTTILFKMVSYCQVISQIGRDFDTSFDSGECSNHGACVMQNSRWVNADYTLAVHSHLHFFVYFSLLYCGNAHVPR